MIDGVPEHEWKKGLNSILTKSRLRHVKPIRYRPETLERLAGRIESKLSFEERAQLQKKLNELEGQANRDDKGLEELFWTARLTSEALARVAGKTPQRVAKFAKHHSTFPFNASLMKKKLEEMEELFNSVQVGAESSHALCPEVEYRNDKSGGRETVFRAIDEIHRSRCQAARCVNYLKEHPEKCSMPMNLLLYSLCKKTWFDLPDISQDSKQQWWEEIKELILEETDDKPEKNEELSRLSISPRQGKKNTPAVRRADILNRLRQTFFQMVKSHEKK